MASVTTENSIEQELADIVGAENVSTAEYELIAYSRDASSKIGKMPDYVVRPRSPEEVSAVLKLANRERIPVVPRANGSNSWGATIPAKGGIVLDTTKMDRIIEINQENMTVTFEPGITNWQISSALEKINKQIGVIPVSTAAATIVGNAVSTGTSPVCSGKYGTQADNVLGLEVVLPTGEFLRTGTAANKFCGPTSFFRHPYGPDITGLFLGSEGSLGVVTKMTVVIYEMPEARKFMEFGFFENGDAMCAAIYEMHSIHHLLLGLVGGHGVGKKAFIRAAKELGRDILKIELDPNHPFTCLCGFEGTQVEVDARVNKACEIVAKHGGVVMEKQGASKTYWGNRFVSMPLHFWKSGRHSQGAITTPLRMTAVARKAFELREKMGMREEDFWYGCNALAPSAVMMRFFYAYDEKDSEDWAKLRAFSKELARVLNEAGAPTYRMGLGSYFVVKDTLPEYYHFLRKIKKALDPNNIMHPGVIGLGWDEDEE